MPGWHWGSLALCQETLPSFPPGGVAPMPWVPQGAHPHGLPMASAPQRGSGNWLGLVGEAGCRLPSLSLMPGFWEPPGHMPGRRGAQPSPVHLSHH